MSKILWFFNRLKAMTPAEVLYRTKKIYNHKVNKVQYKNDINVYDVIDIEVDINKLYKNLEVIFKELDIENIKINNNLEIFSEKINLNNKIDWHKGTKGMWSKEISSYDFEFKDTDHIGDIRVSWEINRHQFMPYLASAYIKTKDKKYIQALENHFNDWSYNNSFLKGINWSSSMEIAIRSYQWLIVLFILKDVEKKNFKEKLCKSIIVSIEYVMNNLSLFSSANNHLILEVGISSIIGYSLDGVYKQNWLDKGYKILTKEIKNQFHEDGVNREQALHYQAFVTDMMLQYNTVIKNIRYKPIEEDLIKKSIEFIQVLGANEQYVDFGDSDDAKILTLSMEQYNYYDYILALASSYYNTVYSSNYDNYPIISLFYKSNCNLEKNKYNELNIYKEGGYSVIRHNNNTLIFDFGELGFKSLAAHGHADALMFLYYKNRKAFFIDSGTYIYNIEKNKRNYYRGTNAHNTLYFNNKNQSEIKGPFLWGKKAISELVNYEENNNEIYIEALHNGYLPYIHKRKIRYIKKSSDIYIYDYFDKEAELNFILDPEVKVKKINDNIYEMFNESKLYLYVTGESCIEEIYVSKKFLLEEKTFKINVKYSFNNNHVSIISSDLKSIQYFINKGDENNENS